MRLISCENCGLVYNDNRLDREPVFEDDGSLSSQHKHEWDDEKCQYSLVVNCICGYALPLYKD